MKAGPAGERCPRLPDPAVALPVILTDYAVWVVALTVAG
jgi:hypothetical protein